MKIPQNFHFINLGSPFGSINGVNHEKESVNRLKFLNLLQGKDKK
jgi:hypothetical protein